MKYVCFFFFKKLLGFIHWKMEDLNLLSLCSFPLSFVGEMNSIRVVRGNYDHLSWFLFLDIAFRDEFFSSAEFDSLNLQNFYITFLLIIILIIIHVKQLFDLFWLYQLRRDLWGPQILWDSWSWGKYWREQDDLWFCIKNPWVILFNFKRFVVCVESQWHFKMQDWRTSIWGIFELMSLMLYSEFGNYCLYVAVCEQDV